MAALITGEWWLSWSAWKFFKSFHWKYNTPYPLPPIVYKLFEPFVSFLPPCDVSSSRPNSFEAFQRRSPASKKFKESFPTFFQVDEARIESLNNSFWKPTNQNYKRPIFSSNEIPSVWWSFQICHVTLKGFVFPLNSEEGCYCPRDKVTRKRGLD